jgi:FAD:protein FMN transferase
MKLLLLSLFTTLLFSVDATRLHMGTYITISLPTAHLNQLNQSFAIFKEEDERFSTYKASSEISKLNMLGYQTLSEHSLDLLKRALQISIETDGYFDITIGRLTNSTYKFNREDATLPTPAKLALEKRAVGFHNIELNDHYAKLDKRAQVDFGGIAKGYTVDLVASYLDKQNITKGVIAASGDIRCIDSCLIAIAHPFYKGKNLASFHTRKPHTAITTSGNYERYIKDTKTNHLLNPKSGRSEQNFASVTLISHNNNTDLDAYATAVSVMPKERAYSFLAKKSEIAYLITESSGETRVSDNLLQFVRDFRFYQ